MKWLSAVVLLLTVSAFADDLHFIDGKNCVGWKTKKTLFLFKHVEPVGQNCDVQAKILNEHNERRLRMVIQINKFDSGEPSRDKEVFKILNGDVQPELIFTSVNINDAALTAMTNAPVDILGRLYISGKEYPVHFMVSSKATEGDVEFTGDLTTTFSHFQIPKISVGFGLIADVDDYLELHFHLLKSQIRDYPK